MCENERGNSPVTCHSKKVKLEKAGSGNQRLFLYVHTPVVTSLENKNQNNLKLIQIKVQRSTLFNWISDLEPSY